MIQSPIPFVDLKTQYARLKPEIDRNIAQVLDHGRFINGPEVGNFEDALKSFCGTGHAVGVGNGTDALQIALMAEGIGPGDAVFVPSFTFTATAEVVLVCGAEPVFCDIEQESYTLDAVDLAKRVAATEREGRLTPKAVIAVDLFGLPADYETLNAFCAERGLLLIADAAQSMGGAMIDKRVGALAPVTATSFFPAKPLGCFGDGGALLTDDDERADTYRSIRSHGAGGAKYDIIRTGMNSRLDTMQAAVLLAKLTVFEDEIAARDRVAARYENRLANLVATAKRFAGRQSAWAQYAIRTENRDGLAAHLKEHGIPTAIYYPLPMHCQTAYKGFAEAIAPLPVSDHSSETILNLPIHPYLDNDTVDRIAGHIADFVTAG